MLQGSRYDEKVDLWAIGVLTYELFYGNSPFDLNEQQDLIKIVRICSYLGHLITKFSTE